jgi:hypothetical protein
MTPAGPADAPVADAGPEGGGDAANASTDPGLRNESGATRALLWLDPLSPEPRANETPAAARKRATATRQRSTLAAIEGTPHVRATTTFWITNVVVVEYNATAVPVARLAALPNVGAVRKNGRLSVDTAAADSVSEPAPGETAALPVAVDLRNTGDLEATAELEFLVDGEVRETVSASVPGNVDDALAVEVPVERGDAPGVELVVRAGNDTLSETVDVEASTATTRPPGNGSATEPGGGTGNASETVTGTSAPSMPGFGPAAAAIAVLCVGLYARYRG